MGDHAAVYGRPAIVATVDLMTEVAASPANVEGVTAELVNLDSHWQWPADFIIEQTETARRSWQAYVAEPTPQALGQLLGEGDAERLAVLAVGEAARAAQREPSGLHLRVASRLPMGAGLGSSASVASAIVGALFGTWSRASGPGQIGPVVSEVERRQHGFPSGVDHRTVLHGGVNWASRTGSEEGLQLGPLRCSAMTQPLVIDTGAPAETTGEVVEEVRARTGGSSWPGWDQLERATHDFRHALKTGMDPRPSVRDYHRWQMELGVVPRSVADWIRSWEDAGGAAKVSGAGATRGDRAGCVVAYPPASDTSLEPALSDDWTRLPVTIGGPGLKVTAG